MTVALVLLCSQATLALWTCWLALRVRRFSRLASAATRRAQAPAQWESRLRDLVLAQESLSSNYEKLERLLQRLNSRAGMRELRAGKHQDAGPPPFGASKAQLRLYYGDQLAKLGPQAVAHQPTQE